MDELADLHMYDDDAERTVLGCMMTSPTIADDVTQLLAADDFYRPANAAVFRTLTRLVTAGDPTDPVSVAHALLASGDLPRVGGATMLHDCVSAVPVAAQAVHYANIVSDWAKRRRVREAGLAAARAATNLNQDVVDVLDQASRTIHAATAPTAQQPVMSVADATDAELSYLDDLAAGRVPQGLTTGMLDLDRLLSGGWRPGQLIIPAGRPAMGKSLLSTGWALAAARAGRPALMYTLEMSRREVMHRLWASWARIPLHWMNNPAQMQDSDWSKLARAAAEMAELPLHIDDTTDSIAGILSHTRRFAQQHGTPGVVVVDYLQRLTFPAGVRDRHDLQVGEAAKALKTMARDLGTTVVAVAQLNRGPEQRTDKRPAMSDLRDSGQLEQEADIVVLVHRDDYYDNESARAGEADLIVAKHRGGPTDTITVAAQLHIARFADMAIASTDN